MQSRVAARQNLPERLVNFAIEYPEITFPVVFGTFACVLEAVLFTPKDALPTRLELFGLAVFGSMLVSAFIKIQDKNRKIQRLEKRLQQLGQVVDYDY